MDERGGAGRVTIVLPLDARAELVRAPAARPASVAGRTIGVLDNGLWRSMATIRAVLAERLDADGPFPVHRYDHLAADFAAQRRGLAPFGRGVELAIAGLGN